MKVKIVSGLAALHLVMVCLGASQLKVWEWPVVGGALSYYGSLTGSGNGYGFFAPGIGDGLKAEFDIERDGSTFIAQLEQRKNREADLRVGNILGILSRNVEDERTRRAVAASWAGKMFAQYPDAKSVTVRLETKGIPEMKDYQAGTRYEWAPFYRAKFVRGQKKKVSE